MNNLAFLDLIDSIHKTRMWIILAWNEIRVRYIRSTLGPFWITLSTLLMVGLMGPLYGTIFGFSTSEYLIYLSVSFVFWNFISVSINESSMIFVSLDSFIKQIKLPYFFYIFKLLFKNFIILLHNIIIILLAFYFSPDHELYQIFLLLIGIIILYLNLVWICLFFAIVGARFRDINQIVVNIVQISFFMSPIMWKIEMLPPARAFLAYYNPFFNLIEIVRRPILSLEVVTFNYLYSLLLLFAGSLFTFKLFSKYRNRIIYWI